MIIQKERYVVTDSTKFIGKFSVYDTATGEETPCHNYHTAKNDAKDKNLIKQMSSYCDCCECDPCDCDGVSDSKE